MDLNSRIPSFDLTFRFALVTLSPYYVTTTKTKEQIETMFEQSLERLAEQILALDEASLANLWDKYKDRMERFDTSREWEKSVIIFFIINAVRVKNKIFNEQVMLSQNNQPQEKKPSGDVPYLKRIK